MSSSSAKSRDCSGGEIETGNLVLGGRLEGEVIMAGSVVDGGELEYGGERTGSNFLDTSSVYSRRLS